MSRCAERGIALPVALFALIVISALVCGNFFAGRLEQQSGRSSVFAAQAFEAAEAGLRDIVSNADPSALGALAVGGVAAGWDSLDLGEGIIAGRQITRLTASLFFVRATGIRHDADGSPLAVRAIGLIARLVVPPSATEPTPPLAPLSPIAERAWVQLY
jgi:uncharacterized protein YbjQ (UPF0145 family)